MRMAWRYIAMPVSLAGLRSCGDLVKENQQLGCAADSLGMAGYRAGESIRSVKCKEPAG
jgi:hypothetical protein